MSKDVIWKLKIILTAMYNCCFQCSNELLSKWLKFFDPTRAVSKTILTIHWLVSKVPSLPFTQNAQLAPHWTIYNTIGPAFFREREEECWAGNQKYLMPVQLGSPATCKLAIKMIFKLLFKLENLWIIYIFIQLSGKVAHSLNSTGHTGLRFSIWLHFTVCTSLLKV